MYIPLHKNMFQKRNEKFLLLRLFLWFIKLIYAKLWIGAKLCNFAEKKPKLLVGKFIPKFTTLKKTY